MARTKGSKNQILSKQDLSVVIDINYQQAIKFITDSIDFKTVLYSREEMDTIRDMLSVFLKIQKHKKIAEYSEVHSPEDILKLKEFQLKEWIEANTND